MLISITLHAADDDARALRIEELKITRFAKITEAAAMGSRILQETNLHFEYETIALHYWQPLGEIEKSKSFKKFIVELYEAFNTGGDIHSILDKAPLVSDDSGTNLDLVVLRVVLQRTLISELTIQYKRLITEVAEINKKLQSLIN